MYYICIENNQVISVLDYRPFTPETVAIKEISDQEWTELKQTNKFEHKTMPNL